MLFSTRSKATKIIPMKVYSQDIPCFHILQHKDSYLGENRYFSLKSYKIPMPARSEVAVRPPNHHYVSKKREEGEKKPKKEKHTLQDKLDDIIIELIKEESNKWESLKRKSKQPVDDDMIGKFQSTLSTNNLIQAFSKS